MNSVERFSTTIFRLPSDAIILVLKTGSLSIMLFKVKLLNCLLITVLADVVRSTKVFKRRKLGDINFVNSISGKNGILL